MQTLPKQAMSALQQRESRCVLECTPSRRATSYICVDDMRRWSVGAVQARGSMHGYIEGHDQVAYHVETCPYSAAWTILEVREVRTFCVRLKYHDSRIHSHLHMHTDSLSAGMHDVS